MEEQDRQHALKRATNRIKNSVNIKILTIGCLIGALLLPSSMIQSLIEERESRKKEVIEEISSKWGNEQTIAGPILTVPYTYFQDSVRYMHFLPDELTVNANLTPEIRYRGIYEAVLYNAKIQLRGTFSFPKYKELNISGEDILWSDAFVFIGISDMQGIREKIDAKINNRAISMDARLNSRAMLESGVSSKISIPTDNNGPIPFSFDIDLNGSHAINFVPVGALTNVTVSSSWSSPSFCGASLPIEREITREGFNAKWKGLHVNRDYPQFWIGNGYTIENSSFGVKLLIAVDIYQKSMRAAKYSFIFVLFTFMAFFFSEARNKKRIHPIQYLLIGFAIMVFYTLLLSISEHANLPIAYLLASVGVTLLITGYSKAIVGNMPFTVAVFVILTVLYGYLYILLQLEDYALLTGSVGLFIILSVSMYVTRKIDWYAMKASNEAEVISEQESGIRNQ